MKVQVNNVDLFEMAQWELDLLADEVNVDELEADLKRRLQWILKHKVDVRYEQFEKQWLGKLMSEMPAASIPRNRQDFVALVKSRPEYKDRKSRDLEAKARGEL